VIVAISSPLVIVFIVLFVLACNQLRRFYSIGSRTVSVLCARGRCGMISLAGDVEH
jgi:hypothetical protein